MNLTLKIWRQNGPEDPGAMHEYQVRGISEESSFLEMLDVLNEELLLAAKNRSHLTLTAVRASVVSVALSSTVLPTALRSPRPASAHALLQ